MYFFPSGSINDIFALGLTTASSFRYSNIDCLPVTYGVEIGDIIGICADSSEGTMENLLISAFSRISRATSLEMIKKNKI